MICRVLIFCFLFFTICVAAQKHDLLIDDKSEKKIIETQLNNNQEILTQFDIDKKPAEIFKQIKTESGIEFFIVKNIAPKHGFYNLQVKNNFKNQDPIHVLNNHPDVISAQYDRPVEFRDTFPDDPRYGEQWHYPHIGLPSVWDVSTGGWTANGDEIVVAVLDSGFDINHEDLQGNIWVNQIEAMGIAGEDDDGNGLIDDLHGWNFVTESNELLPFGSTGHGTSSAGIVGAKGNNGVGVSGVNWDVKLMLIVVKNISEIVAGFYYVLDQRELYNNTNGAEGAFIVATNGSFGIPSRFCSEEPAWGGVYDLLGQQGVLSAASTANENWDVDEVGDLPTSCESEFLISVTSIDTVDKKMEKVAFGEQSIDLAAPGFETLSPSVNIDYNPEFGGNSAASPHVAGTIALLYSMPCPDLADLAMSDPPAAALLMRDALLQNTVPVPTLRGKTVTGGRLDAYESMKHIHSWCIGTPEDRASEQVKEVYQGRRAMVRLYPNPSSDQITVDFAALEFDRAVTFRVFNMLGQEVVLPFDGIALPFEKQQVQLDVTDWASGIYVLNILDNSQKISLPFMKL
ncbi:MAG: S8/S53 family peptidase [Bacteroidota bacterium]